jgi:hypothetical protein
MNSEKLPPWALRLILIVSLSISAAALFLTRTYAVGNLYTLGLDADTIFVRKLSIDVLLAAHVAALFIATVLPDKYFSSPRWKLYTLAFAIWVFDGFAIYQARWGVMDSADQAQVSATARLADQRAAIKELQESAAALRTTAERQMANGRITAGAASQNKAASLADKAAAMSEELATMPSGAGTSEVRTWGWWARWKAVAESALISFVSLVMLALSGLMGRELLQLSAARRPAPVPARPAALAPDAPAQVRRVQKTGAFRPRTRDTRARPRFQPGPAAPAAPAMPFGFVPPTAPQARHAGADSGAVWSAPRRDYALRPSRPAAPAPAAPAAPAPTNAPAQVQNAPVEVQNAPAQVQKAKSASAPPPVPDGVRNAIKAGAISPTLRGIKSMARGQDFAVAWLAQLGAEGVLEPTGNGRWKLRESAT